jgi:predicted 2-oxoglutarate/Fe(II)-dependent dioxygenase YbiX
MSFEENLGLSVTPTLDYDLFSTCECLDIVSHATSNSEGCAASTTSSRADYRVAWTFEIRRNPDTVWIWDRISLGLERANRKYGFKLSGEFEALQCVRYTKENFFRWHSDLGSSYPNRKISLSVQLSNHSDYVGGDLEFSGLRELQLIRRQGTLVAFPSFLAHRVTPVSEGTRYALIAWAEGPPFR